VEGETAKFYSVSKVGVGGDASGLLNGISSQKSPEIVGNFLEGRSSWAEKAPEVSRMRGGESWKLLGSIGGKGVKGGVVPPWKRIDRRQRFKRGYEKN